MRAAPISFLIAFLFLVLATLPSPASAAPGVYVGTGTGTLEVWVPQMPGGGYWYTCPGTYAVAATVSSGAGVTSTSPPTLTQRAVLDASAEGGLCAPPGVAPFVGHTFGPNQYAPPTYPGIPIQATTTGTYVDDRTGCEHREVALSGLGTGETLVIEEGRFVNACVLCNCPWWRITATVDFVGAGNP